MGGDGVVLKNSMVCSFRTRTPTPTRDFLQSIGIGPSTVTTTSAHSSITSDLDGSIDDQELNAILGLNNSSGSSADKPAVAGDGVQVGILAFYGGPRVQEERPKVTKMLKLC